MSSDDAKVQARRAELDLQKRERLAMQAARVRSQCKHAETAAAHVKAREAALAQRLEGASADERANIEAELKSMAAELEDLQTKQDTMERQHRALSEQLDAARAAA